MPVRTGALWLLTLLYPIAIYFGIGRFEPRWLALLLLVIAVGRAVVSRDKLWFFAAAGACVLVIVSMLGNQALPLKLYPALVNGVMLAVFALMVGLAIFWKFWSLLSRRRTARAMRRGNEIYRDWRQDTVRQPLP